MRGEYPFGKKRNAFGVIAEPIIRIPVLTRYGYQNFDFLVDTGADVSILPVSVAEDLDISLDDCPEIKLRGIGENAVTAYIGKMTVKILAVPVAITCAFSEKGILFLLGRKDIFSRFSILFDNARNVVRFNPF